MELVGAFLSEQTIERIGWMLVHFLWQGIAIGALMWCVLKALAKASSDVRYIVACAGLLLMAAAPVVTFVVTAPDAPLAVIEVPVEVTYTPAPAATETIGITPAPQPPASLPAPSLRERFTGWLDASLLYCVSVWFVAVSFPPGRRRRAYIYMRIIIGYPDGHIYQEYAETFS